MINPFEPVYKNILVPLITSQIQPYVTLYKQSLQPLYNLVTTRCENHSQAVKRYEGCIRTLELIVQFSFYFFLYQNGWHYGIHYFGLVGGAAAFSLIYGAGDFVDRQLQTNMNNICTGTWLYYQGISNLSTNREAMLVSIIIAGHLTHQQNETSPTGWEKKRTAVAEGIATRIEWLTARLFSKPKPSSEPPTNTLKDDTVNRTQNPPDGESQ